MPGEIYDVSLVLDKTLIAAQEVSIFDGVPETGYMPKKLGVVKAGNPVGIVYSYINADASEGRDNLWWVLSPTSDWDAFYYAPHAAGLYDVSSLRQQGVLSLNEQAQQEAEANKPWYTKVLSQVLPVVAITVLGAALIHGYMSRKQL